MKKNIVHIAMALALSFMLCGCGSAKDDSIVDNTVPTALPSPTATTAPIVTPDVEDGVITDGDGIIDDNTVDPENTITGSVNPAPSTKPSSDVKK